MGEAAIWHAWADDLNDWTGLCGTGDRRDGFAGMKRLVNCPACLALLDAKEGAR